MTDLMSVEEEIQRKTNLLFTLPVVGRLRRARRIARTIRTTPSSSDGCVPVGTFCQTNGLGWKTLGVRR